MKLELNCELKLVMSECPGVTQGPAFDALVLEAAAHLPPEALHAFLDARFKDEATELRVKAQDLATALSEAKTVAEDLRAELEETQDELGLVKATLTTTAEGKALAQERLLSAWEETKGCSRERDAIKALYDRDTERLGQYTRIVDAVLAWRLQVGGRIPDTIEDTIVGAGL